MGQKRFDEAISYYSRALAVARPRVNDTDAEAGRIYGRIAIAYHAMRNLDKAREFYRRATKTYQIAYSNINEEEVTEEGIEMKRGYLKMLRSILEFHLLAAEQAGESGEVKEIKKEIESLPK
jgi:tetratricopeptide (TPR) repeat protein